VGLAMGALFGVAGSFFTSPVLQIILYEISTVGLTAASALLCIKFLRQKNDLLASGFLLLAIAEAVMSAGATAGQVDGQPSFAAGMALYVPAFLIIGFTNGFPVWTRFTIVAAVIPFLIAASIIFSGGLVLSTSAFPGAGYGFLTLTIIGWVIFLIRENKNHLTANQE
jgi:hypothetical protein